MAEAHQQATLGGGCFWCLEAVFEQLRGVERIVSGYAGGDVPDPTYEQVCGGTTGHAEVVQITFDPGDISYRELLEIFFTMHDPTTPNRQGPDRGPQYRSIVLYHDESQKRDVEEVLANFEQSEIFDDPVVTEVVPLKTFYPAEAYHQEYFRHHTWQPYCQSIIAPKVTKLRSEYFERLKAEAK